VDPGERVTLRGEVDGWRKYFQGEGEGFHLLSPGGVPEQRGRMLVVAQRVLSQQWCEQVGNGQAGVLESTEGTG